MLKYHNYNIVFQEVPGEVTLAVNISGCPNTCKGCHSPYLREDIGEVLSEISLDELIVKYGKAITCICFMGGDADPKEVERLSIYVHETTNLKTAWYSGRQELPDININNYNYIKLGPYTDYLGPLGSPTTNQRFYKIESGEMIDLTKIFEKYGVNTDKE